MLRLKDLTKTSEDLKRERQSSVENSKLENSLGSETPLETTEIVDLHEDKLYILKNKQREAMFVTILRDGEPFQIQLPKLKSMYIYESQISTSLRADINRNLFSIKEVKLDKPTNLSTNG